MILSSLLYNSYKEWWKFMSKVNKPLYFYLMLFLLTTLIGAFLLYLPYTGKKPINFIDALFVASSAFTVTGLSPVDVGTQFNIFGEIIILLLIQIGGLGIVTVAMLTLIFLNKKISINNRILFMITWNIDEPGGVIKLIKHLAIYSIATELFGTLCLCLSFIPKFGIGKGLFLSLFTSVSAFNNAGFALFKNNLIDFSNDPVIIITIPILIILGGLGHLVVVDLWNAKSFRKLLILIGTVFFFLLENQNSMLHMGLIEKIGNAFFQSVTTRTAGFNTIDVGNIKTPTALLLMALMFIGGAPLSAAGGIKVTTFVIATIAIFNTIRKEKNNSIFNREISERYIQLSFVTILISIAFIGMVTFILTIINSNIPLIKILFEVVSAFGTVGLTMDLTSEYYNWTEFIIIIVMLCGKIGLLNISRALVPPKDPKNYRYTKGHIHL